MNAKQEILEIIDYTRRQKDLPLTCLETDRIRTILETHELVPVDTRPFDPALCGFVKIQNTLEDWTNGKYEISYRKGVGLIERLEGSFIFGFPWPETQSAGRKLLELLGVLG